MEKIKLGDFIRNMSAIVNYSERHMVKEDWHEWSGSELPDVTFEEMGRCVVALSKTRKYMTVLMEYDEHGNKRESIFLDD